MSQHEPGQPTRSAVPVVAIVIGVIVGVISLVGLACGAVTLGWFLMPGPIPKPPPRIEEARPVPLPMPK